MPLIDDLKKERNPGCEMMMNNPAEEKLLFDHLQPTMRVLEFGSGLSTIAIAKRVSQVISIEHDHKFYKEFKPDYPSNAIVMFVAPNNEKYYDDGTASDFDNYIKAAVPDKDFDIVFIDGRARIGCAEFAAKHYLKPGGKIFIHDYRHPQPQYRRHYLEQVEMFLVLEKQEFAMAMFSVKEVKTASGNMPWPEKTNQQEIVLTEQQPTGIDSAMQKILNDQIREMGGTPWNDSQESIVGSPESAAPSPVIANCDEGSRKQERAEGEVETATQEDIDDNKQLAESGIEDYAAQIEKEAAMDEPATENQQPETSNQQPPTDKTTCWYDLTTPAEMNRFYDEHIKSPDITKHMEPFTRLLNCIVADSDHHLLDLGCGTAMLADWVPGFEYYGADLPHIVAGCALRNHPFHFYRGCDMVDEDISWISRFDVIAMSGIIDIMQHPLGMLKKVLQHTKKYLLIHRQEITNEKPTGIEQGPGYGGSAWHSNINRGDFNKAVDDAGFRIVTELACGFQWENGGSSFLLVRITPVK